MTELRIRRLGYALGAEITGFDAAKDLDDETIAKIRRASLDHIVICLPGQNLDARGFREFCARFGTLDDSRTAPHNRHAEHEEVQELSNKPIVRDGKAVTASNIADRWHSDRAFTLHPTPLSFLLAKKLPSVGGNTMFANTYMAYDALSPALRTLLDSMLGVYDAAMGASFAQNPALQADMRKRNPPVVHPIVKVHPETARKALFVGVHTRRFVGMSDEESRPLLDFLREHSTRYEFIYRHRWAVNDLIVWDNRCAIHYAVRDYDLSELRLMLRCALHGPKSGHLYDEAADAAAPVTALVKS